jgi:hypothetical protein
MRGTAADLSSGLRFIRKCRWLLTERKDPGSLCRTSRRCDGGIPRESNRLFAADQAGCVVAAYSTVDPGSVSGLSAVFGIYKQTLNPDSLRQALPSTARAIL